LLYLYLFSSPMDSRPAKRVGVSNDLHLLTPSLYSGEGAPLAPLGLLIRIRFVFLFPVFWRVWRILPIGAWVPFFTFFLKSFPGQSFFLLSLSQHILSESCLPFLSSDVCITSPSNSWLTYVEGKLLTAYHLLFRGQIFPFLPVLS